jgi:pseudouridine-5'-phosphate glycosidase
MKESPLDISKAVRSALAAGEPVVALESTLIAHGMPYPANLEIARELEAIIREGGAIPATIAVLKGRLRVGLTGAELEFVASDPTIAKASVRDLPVLIGKQLDGATTVSATMRISAMSGITVFATGGIGGVHREAQRTFDVSSDLSEFALSRVAVVSAGAKAILDLPATLERLETLGVPVIGYGTDEFPAFYSRSSGLKTPWRADSPDELAAIVLAQRALAHSGGILIANPIPSAFEMPAVEMKDYIQDAATQAKAAGVTGKDLTPYLLRDIAARTQGRSQVANAALVRNNAELAAKLAVALVR